jgi:hypothetical protein
VFIVTWVIMGDIATMPIKSILKRRIGSTSK